MILPEDISHRIERTRNKHSRAVYRDDTIVIRLARNLSRIEEREHIDSLLKRMTRQVLKERQKRIIDPFRPLLKGAERLTVTLANGTTYTFTLTPGSRLKAKRNAEGWHIELAPQTRRQQLHRFLWKLLSQSENAHIASLVDDINRSAFQTTIDRVRLGYAATQWGSCSRRATVMLNAVLLFLPEHLLRYVIVHELAHRFHPNHSQRYWKTVAKALPTYQEARRKLRQYRICAL